MERILLYLAIFVLVFFTITFAGYVKAYHDGELANQRISREAKAYEKHSQEPAEASKRITEEIDNIKKRYEIDSELKNMGAGDLTPEQLRDYLVALVTNHGAIVIGFDSDGAVGHGRKFLTLAASDTYNGSQFHRIYADTVIFGGGPIPREADEYLADELKRKHVRGAVSLSNQGRSNTASQEFFICLKPIPDYDTKYSVFGHVVEGIEVVELISRKETIINRDTGERDLPAKTIKSVKVLVLKKPKTAAKAEAAE